MSWFGDSCDDLWKRVLLEHVLIVQRKVNRMSLDLQKLTADVAAQQSVIQSAVTLITGFAGSVTDLKNQLAAAIAANDPAALAAVQAELDKLDTELKANTSTLSAAVTQNTPAPAPAPSPTPSPPST